MDAVLENMEKLHGIQFLEREGSEYLACTPGLPAVLRAQDPGKVRSWLEKHRRMVDQASILICYGLSCGQAAATFLNRHMEVSTEVIWKKGLPEPSGCVRLEPAGETDLPLILEHYHLLDPDEIRLAVRENRMEMIRRDGRTIGFCGMHQEGTMGMLYILEPFRRKGSALEAQRELIRLFLKKGLVPCAHIFDDNLASLALQKKAGMDFTPDKVCWII